MLFCICPPCRDTSIQSSRVDPIPSILWATSHRLVTRCAAVWHGVWRHPLWTWRGDPNGTDLFQAESLLGSVYPVIEIVYCLCSCFAALAFLVAKRVGKLTNELTSYTQMLTSMKHERGYPGLCFMKQLHPLWVDWLYLLTHCASASWIMAEKEVPVFTKTVQWQDCV